MLLFLCDEILNEVSRGQTQPLDNVFYMIASKPMK
jgi:hypothetical protein